MTLRKPLTLVGNTIRETPSGDSLVAPVNRTQVSDAAYTILATDALVAIIALTAARTLTLPAASAYPLGATLTVVDESGNCSGTNTITIAPAGSDKIDGGGSVVINSGYGYFALESNGAGAWTIVNRTVAGLGRQNSNAVTITGGTVDNTVVGGTTPAAGTFTTLTGTGAATFQSTVGIASLLSISPATSGTAGAINKVNLYGGTYGLGVSNVGSLDYVSGSAHSFYYGSALTAQITTTGLNGTVIGATTPASGKFTTVGASSAISSTLAPQTGWTLDASGNPQSVASGGTLLLAAGSGLVILHNLTNGDMGVYAVSAGTVKLVISTGGTWVASASPGSGTVGLSYSSGNGAYTVTNAYGSAIQVTAMLMRTRTSN